MKTSTLEALMGKMDENPKVYRVGSTVPSRLTWGDTRVFGQVFVAPQHCGAGAADGLYKVEALNGFMKGLIPTDHRPVEEMPFIEEGGSLSFGWMEFVQVVARSRRELTLVQLTKDLALPVFKAGDEKGKEEGNDLVKSSEATDVELVVRVCCFPDVTLAKKAIKTDKTSIQSASLFRYQQRLDNVLKGLF